MSKLQPQSALSYVVQREVAQASSLESVLDALKRTRHALTATKGTFAYQTKEYSAFVDVLLKHTVIDWYECFDRDQKSSFFDAFFLEMPICQTIFAIVSVMPTLQHSFSKSTVVRLLRCLLFENQAFTW